MQVQSSTPHLPKDIIVKIMCHTRNKPTGFKNLLLVCKDWNRWAITEAMPQWINRHKVTFWTNTSTVKRVLNYGDNDTFKRLFGPKVTRLSTNSSFFCELELTHLRSLELISMRNMEACSFARLMSLVPHLEKLNCEIDPFNTHIMPTMPTGLRSLNLFSSNKPLIDHIIAQTTNLKKLKLNFYGDEISLTIPQAVTKLNLTRIEPLKLENNTRLKKLSLLFVANIEKLSPFPSSLSSLTIHFQAQNPSANELYTALPAGLEMLALTLSKELPQNFFSTEWTKFTSLRLFGIACCLTAPQPLPAITHLALSYKSSGQFTIPPKIEGLQLETSLVFLPVFENLHQLMVSDSPNLTHLSIPPRVKSLQVSSCSGLFSLSDLPDSLEFIYLSEMTNLSVPKDYPPNLRKLQLFRLEKRFEIGTLPTTLRTLRITECGGLREIEKLSQLTLLKIKLSNCENLVGLPYLPQSLITLNVNYCEDLSYIKTPLPPRLSTLLMKRCVHLKDNFKSGTLLRIVKTEETIFTRPDQDGLRSGK